MSRLICGSEGTFSLWPPAKAHAVAGTLAHPPPTPPPQTPARLCPHTSLQLTPPPFYSVHSTQFHNITEELRRERDKREDFERQIAFLAFLPSLRGGGGGWGGGATCAGGSCSWNAICGRNGSYLFFSLAWGNCLFTAHRARVNFKWRGFYFSQEISFFNFTFFCLMPSFKSGMNS